MLPAPPFRLPPPLERATQRVRHAAQRAAEQTRDGLGLAALAAPQLQQRDALLGAQYELHRKTAQFVATFNEALDQEVARAAGLLSPSPQPAPTAAQLVASWESLTLVDDVELELHLSAERFALALSHACEWELRELDAYVATLLGLTAADHARNPLRAEVVAQALMRGVDTLSGRPEVRQVLATHIGRALSLTLRQAYADIVAELRGAGVRPAGLAVRQVAARAPSGGDGPHGSAAVDGGPAGTRAKVDGGPAATCAAVSPAGRTAPSAGAMRAAEAAATPVVPAFSTGVNAGRGTVPGSTAGAWPASAAATPLGAVPSGMMGMLRDLARAPWPAATGDGYPAVAGGADIPNLIQAHRGALRQLASGALDHLVIDLVAGLFDQILSDTKVPPQFVRQIARLQLPVLRAALGDPDFFASRRHPVRRLVNRIASLGAAVDDVDDEAGAALLEQVTAVVQAVVEGDFDLAETYEQQLARLDAFVADQAQAEVAALGDAGAVLARKEGELRQQQQFGQVLGQALSDLPVPDYLREFLTDTWARAIARAELKEGPDSPLSRHLRAAGRDLVMSVQPKGSPVQRQHFLRRLPQLMKDLNLGLDHARCPAEARRAFFARLLPAHAQALKSPPLTTLDHNLLFRQVESAMAAPLPPAVAAAGFAAPAARPGATGAADAADAALQAAARDQAFTPAEAHQVGLVAEHVVDWQATALDIDLSGETPLTEVDIALDGLPAPEAPEPTRGGPLVDHLQLGMAYQMHLEGRWHKVRLAHVSASRSFYVFTHGQGQRRTVTMTYRMVQRLCADGRLRAFEAAYLLERATARVRRELARLRPAAA